MHRNNSRLNALPLPTMQLAISSNNGVELLANEPFPLQTDIQACHGRCQLVLHHLQAHAMLASATCFLQMQHQH